MKRKAITLPCDCHCCMLVIEKTKWKDGEINYCITVQDNRYDHNFNTPWGRIKRAAKVLFGKPIYYNEVFMQGTEDFQKLVDDMRDLAAADLDDET